MNKSLLIPFLFLTATILNAQKNYKYPDTPKDTIIDIFYSDSIIDSYQWMENPTDLRLIAWLKAQEKITKKQSNRQIQILTLRAQIATIYNKVKVNTRDSYVNTEDKTKKKYKFDYKYDDYGQTPNLYYKRAEGNYYKYKMLVNTEKFQQDKNDNVKIINYTVNNKLDLIAVEISHNASDWREIFFFDLSTGKQLPDILKNLRIGSQVIWHNRGVYYDSYKKPKEGRELLDKAIGQTVYYHKMGKLQIEDVMLLQNQDTTGTNSIYFFKNKKNRLFFRHFYFSRGNIYNAYSYSDLKEDNSIFLRNFLIFENNDSTKFKIEVILGDTVILKTTLNAPNGKVLMANIKQKNNLIKIVPEYDIPLENVNRLGKDRIACIYKNNGASKVLIYNLNGDLIKSMDFPVGEKVNSFYETDPKAEYTNFCVSSFFHPDIWYQLSLKNLTYTPTATLWLPYNAKQLETKYVKYKSKDGTEIPMYITCLKETELNGKNPTLLYGYGGYGKTVEPDFDKSKALWLLHGGILAIPNVRGGGAKGNKWGKEGRRLKKQNTIDDFIAAAEYLIQEKYTNPNKLAINGGSHGGLLVGATITQRPELFKAAIAEAGVFDMLRFEKYTIGSTSTSIKEFGTVTNQSDYNNLKSYSPFHNIKKNTKYPNVLLITGNKDDRVPPFHSFKFLAKLQDQGDPTSLFHLYLIPGAGHSGALTNDDWVDKMLFKYYFLFDQLDLDFL